MDTNDKLAQYIIKKEMYIKLLGEKNYYSMLNQFLIKANKYKTKV